MAESLSPLFKCKIVMDGKVDNRLTDVRRSVREKLRSGVFKLSRDKRGSRRSKVWEHFRMVLDEQGGSVGYAGCMYCLDVLKHDPHMSGTSSLFSHLRSCPGSCQAFAAVPVENLSDVYVKEEVVEGEEPKENEEWVILSNIADVCAECVASDLLPYQALHGEGFRRLAQLLVEYGAQHGKFDVQSVLPNPSAVAERVWERACEERRTLRVQLASTLGRGAALVLPQPHPHHTPLRPLLLHSVREWSIETHFLGICDLRDAKKNELEEQVSSILKKFELEVSPERLVAVVRSGEGGSGVWGGEAATITCFTHMLTKAVNHLLENDNPIVEDIRINLQKLRYIARQVSEGTVKLSKQLKTDCEGGDGGWREAVSLAEELCDFGSELLRETNLTDDSLALMQHFTALLNPFRTAVDDLEALDIATLHKVVPWILHLKKSCSSDPKDTRDMSTMKMLIKEGLETHADIHQLHKVAVFFNPRMNSLKILCAEEREAVREEILRMAKVHVQSNGPPIKRMKTESNSPLAYMEDADQDDDPTAEREMKLYTIMKDHTNSDNLLTWWKHNSGLLPLLSSLAGRVLGVPASATPSPCLASIADKAQQLSSSLGNSGRHSIDDLIFLHSRLSNP